MNSQPELISYIALRRWVGVLGIALPWVLYIGFKILATDNCLQPASISHYYYTCMGNYFTGTLCAVGLFLYTYKGQDNDGRVMNFAAVCALLVAFCATNAEKDFPSSCSVVNISINPIRNAIHYAAAGLLFSTLAYISLVLFRKTGKHNSKPKPGEMKYKRNTVYKTCGIVIIVCIACIPLFTFTALGNTTWATALHLNTYIFEAIALQAFGISWLIKGNTLFKDKPIPPSSITNTQN